MSEAKPVVVPHAADLSEDWDEIVRRSRNGTFLHLRGFIEYHAHRFDEHSALVLLDGRPAFVFPCTRHGDVAVSHGGLTYGGLVYGAEMRAGICREVFAALKEHYRAQGFARILYKAVPHIFHSRPAEEDLYALFAEGGRLARRDLATAIAMADRPAFSTLRKRGVRKAEKAGLAVREGRFFAQFHDLLSATLEKFGARPVHSLEEIALLQSRFPENIRLFGAFDGDRLAAATWIFDHGRTAHTQYLCSSAEGRRVGALDFLIHRLLEGPFAERAFFSFGISTEDEGRRLNAGLAFQKEGFGGRGIVHDFYDIPL